jgi:hypothetical protein
LAVFFLDWKWTWDLLGKALDGALDDFGVEPLKVHRLQKLKSAHSVVHRDEMEDIQSDLL